MPSVNAVAPTKFCTFVRKSANARPFTFSPTARPAPAATAELYVPRYVAAVVLEKNEAVRAFCNETSVPNIGASGVRAMPRILPSRSTTETVTCAKLPFSGRRICARAEKATLSALQR